MTETTNHHWKLPPKRLRLAESSIHVWRADLTAADDGVGELLSSDERERGQRFVFAKDRERWLRARGILRALLGIYLDLDASELRFTTGPHGKPALLSGSVSLHFNVSHSEDLALYAFAKIPVGVDVEIERPGIDAIALAERAFDRDQADRLRRLPAGERERAFLRVWVRHEASLKCRGDGLGAYLDQSGLWLTDIDVGSGAAAAVALDGTPEELCLWEWAVAAH
jgi:4'-phosphopantetheinyl transferase